MRTTLCLVLQLITIALHFPSTHSFSAISSSSRACVPDNNIISRRRRRMINNGIVIRKKYNSKLYAEDEDNESTITSFSDSESTLLGITVIIASLIMLYSESVLFQTGCGLPSGPLGLVGAAEGVSYLGVVGLVGFSLFTKLRTGSGLPAGPGGILGAGEGLAYLAVLAGFLVLVAQVTNFGYIPNAVPMEGGMCQ